MGSKDEKRIGKGWGRGWGKGEKGKTGKGGGTNTHHIEGVVGLGNAVQVSKGHGGHLAEVHVGGVVIGQGQTLQVALGRDGLTLRGA